MTEATAIVLQALGIVAAAVLLGGVLLWRSPRFRAAAAALARLVRPLAGEGENTPAPRNPQRARLADGRRWLLVGAPGSGKTTAARHLVRAYLRAGADVTILDPDGSAWPRGARMVGAPDDYAAIAAALDQLGTLAGERRAQFLQGVRDFAPVLVLVDEAPSVLRSTPGAIDAVADLARRGRKLAISVVLLAQDTQARTLGIEGMTKLLDAFDRLDCRMTPAGVELVEAGTVRTLAPLDLQAADLALPLVASSTPHAAPAAPSTTPSAPAGRLSPADERSADRILAEALAAPPARNAATGVATGVAGAAMPQIDPSGAIAQTVEAAPDLAETLPPAVAQRLAAIDWRTVAELVEGGALGETAALRALGFPASSTSAKYQAARERLQAARRDLAGSV